MSTDRRKFLKVAAAASGAFLLTDTRGALASSLIRPDPRDGAAGKAAAPLNILILGGTGFTGPEQVNYALQRGHKVTLFNRNKTRPERALTSFRRVSMPWLRTKTKAHG